MNKSIERAVAITLRSLHKYNEHVTTCADCRARSSSKFDTDINECDAGLRIKRRCEGQMRRHHLLIATARRALDRKLSRLDAIDRKVNAG